MIEGDITMVMPLMLGSLLSRLGQKQTLP
jgi:hypothetical protein